MIYGTGWAGAELLREFGQHEYLKFNVIGFIDDEPTKTYKRFEVSGFGSHADIIKVVGNCDIDAVILHSRNVKTGYYLQIWLEKDVDTIEMPVFMKYHWSSAGDM